MTSRTVSQSALFVGVVFVGLLVLGSILSSGPSAATIEADRQPASTTTTIPVPEGVFVVHLDNGVLRPSNLEIDLDVVQIVQWVNDDGREFVLEDSDGSFTAPLGPDDTFEFDYSTLPPGLYRYTAVLVTDSLFGGVRIPGLVDTRAAQ